jgi:hypothetical protein
MIWLQVRDVHAGYARLAAAGVSIVREPIAEPWGLIEMQLKDPDGIRIVLVEVPANHPLRLDPRPGLQPGRRTRMPHNNALHRNAPVQRPPGLRHERVIPRMAAMYKYAG